MPGLGMSIEKTTPVTTSMLLLALAEASELLLPREQMMTGGIKRINLIKLSALL